MWVPLLGVVLLGNLVGNDVFNRVLVTSTRRIWAQIYCHVRLGWLLGNAAAFSIALLPPAVCQSFICCLSKHCRNFGDSVEFQISSSMDVQRQSAEGRQPEIQLSKVHAGVPGGNGD